MYHQVITKSSTYVLNHRLYNSHSVCGWQGTVLIKSAQELKDFSRGEENQLEEQIKAIADSGAKVCSGEALSLASTEAALSAFCFMKLGYS